jgi:hypothetical protein
MFGGLDVHCVNGDITSIHQATLSRTYSDGRMSEGAALHDGDVASEHTEGAMLALLKLSLYDCCCY